MWQGFRKQLATPVSGESLGFFRLSFGLVMLLFCIQMLLTYGGQPWYEIFFSSSPDFYTFRYPGFEWVRPLPRGVFAMLVNVLCISCLLVAVGLKYRISCIVMFLLWTYVFLLERSYYNNHYYLMSLISFLLIFMPGDAAFSMDNWLRSDPRQPADRRQIPFWPIFLLRAQLLLVYFFAGVTKLNAEWLVAAAPVREFLADPAILEPYKPYLSSHLYEQGVALLHSDWFAYFVTYTGTIYDLLVGFLLIFRRTRLFAFVLTVLFHAANHFFFFDNIDIFPLMATLSTTIFFDPDWPSRVWTWIKTRRIPKPDWGWLIGGAIVVPVVGAFLGWKIPPTPREDRTTTPLSKVATLFILLWIAVQAVVPIRHYAIPGEVNWTQEGELFSWRVKAAVRDHRTTRFAVLDPKILSEADGELTVDWDALELPPKLFVDLDVQAIPWKELPPIIVTSEPLAGERILFNPWFGNREVPMTVEEGTEWVRNHWRQRYGREPQAIEPCLGIATVVEKTLPLIDRKQFDKLIGTFLDDASILTKKLTTESMTPRERKSAIMKLNNLMVVFSRIGTIENEVRSNLRLAEPFAFSGAGPVGAPVLYIKDDAMFVDQNPERSIVPAALGYDGKTSGPLPVYFALDSLAMHELQRMPKVFVVQDDFRGTYLFWNACRDQLLYQIRRLMSGPLPCRDYASHIAEWWEAKYGRRPEVMVEMWMKLHAHPEQLAIDPDIDLSTAPIEWFGHHPWIYDLGDPKAFERAERHLPRKDDSVAPQE